MYKIHKRDYKLIDDFQVDSVDYLIDADKFRIVKKESKINKTRENRFDDAIPNDIKDLLAHMEDDDED